MFYHFVGAVPGSPNLESTLKRLLKELGIVNVSLEFRSLATSHLNPWVKSIITVKHLAEGHVCHDQGPIS